MNQVKLYFDEMLRSGNKKRKVEDHNMTSAASRQPPYVQLPNLDGLPNSDGDSDSKAQVLGIGNVSSYISNEELINFNSFSVCECKQFSKEKYSHLWQETLGFDNVRKCFDWPTSQIKTVIGDGNCFFRVLCYLLAGTKELYAYIRFKVTQFLTLKGNTYRMHNPTLQLKMEKKFMFGLQRMRYWWQPNYFIET